MFKRQTYNIIIGVFILFSLTLCSAYGYDDGFGSATKSESDHFTIYYAPRLDINLLTQQLNISPADIILAGRSTQGTLSSGMKLTDMLDIIFTRACDVLDMQLFSLKVNIKICQDYNQLSIIYNNLFNSDLKGRPAFYVYPLNTIYISAENFKRSVIGHETAHAIISHYFVVQPSIKIQEVLASYVEYQLRKDAQ